MPDIDANEIATIRRVRSTLGSWNNKGVGGREEFDALRSMSGVLSDGTRSDECNGT